MPQETTRAHVLWAMTNNKCQTTQEASVQVTPTFYFFFSNSLLIAVTETRRGGALPFLVACLPFQQRTRRGSPLVPYLPFQRWCICLLAGVQGMPSSFFFPFSFLTSITETRWGALPFLVACLPFNNEPGGAIPHRLLAISMTNQKGLPPSSLTYCFNNDTLLAGVQGTPTGFFFSFSFLTVITQTRRGGASSSSFACYSNKEEGLSLSSSLTCHWRWQEGERPPSCPFAWWAYKVCLLFIYFSFLTVITAMVRRGSSLLLAIDDDEKGQPLLVARCWRW
jgi:hypothetical protein